MTLPPASLGSTPPVDPTREADLDRAKEQFLERLRTKDLGDDARQWRQRREDQEREEDARREQAAVRSRPAPNAMRDPAPRPAPAPRAVRPGPRPIAAPLLPAGNVDPAPDHPLGDLLVPRRSALPSTLTAPSGGSLPGLASLPLPPGLAGVPPQPIAATGGAVPGPIPATDAEAYTLQEIAAVSAADGAKPAGKSFRLNSQVPPEIARRIEAFGRTGILDMSPVRFTAPDILVDGDSPLPDAPAGRFPTGPFPPTGPKPPDLAAAEAARAAALSARWPSLGGIDRPATFRGGGLRVIQGGGGVARDPFGGTPST